MFRRLLPSLLALAAAGAFAGGADAHFKRATANAFDDETPWAEQANALPAYSASPSWVDFTAGNTERNRLSVDSSALEIGADGVVRYTLRVLSPGGVANISREGMRCADRTLRSYAFGDTIGQRWIESAKPVWRPIRAEDSVRHALRERLCDGGTPRRSVEATVAELIKQG